MQRTGEIWQHWCEPIQLRLDPGPDRMILECIDRQVRELALFLP